MPSKKAQGEAPVLRGNRAWVEGEWCMEENASAARFGVHWDKLLHEEQSPYQKIKVFQSAKFGHFLTLDDCMMLTERDEFVYHEMLTHIPLCSIRQPKSVLVIGGGDMGIIREVLKHESIERAVLCEIDERVTRVCEDYFPWVKESIADPRVELVFDDGVKYIENNQNTFDLIIVDSTDPVGPAEGLFLSEFYSKVEQALRPGGVMVAQTESPHWHASLLSSIYAQMRKAFPYVTAYMGWIPTYPSGSWSWAYATRGETQDSYFDEARAYKISATCRYYNPAIHKAAFALPNFVREAIAGLNPFARFDKG